MRAVVVDAAGGPECLELRELPRPGAGPGQVLVRVAYCPLNPLDVQARAGRVRWSHPEFPFIPGCGFAGRVEQLGPGVDAGLLGQRVTVAGCWGGNAEYAAVPAGQLKRIPDRFSWILGSVAAGTARTAWHLVHSAGRLAPGQWLVVHSAAGPVGALTAQMARSAGARVIGLAGGQAKVRFAARFADHALDYERDDWPAAVRRLTAGRGADVIIDGNSGPRAALNYDATAPLGTVVYMGAQAGPAPDLPVALLIARGISVCGFIVNHHEARDPEGGQAEIEERLARGDWTIPVATVAPLDDVAALHRQFEARALMGRAVIRVGGEI